MECCLCKNEIEKQGAGRKEFVDIVVGKTQQGWDLGNNAMPLMDGRCCNKCNNTKVIPARIKKSIKKIDKGLDETIKKIINKRV